MLQQALLASRLFATCCRLINVGHRLSYTCFGRVCKGLMVFNTAEHIALCFELFVMTIWLV